MFSSSPQQVQSALGDNYHAKSILYRLSLRYMYVLTDTAGVLENYVQGTIHGLDD